ncbi:MAG: phage tail tape measure protein [Candidatus Heimdallarchaeaceae archaeon]
MAFSLNLGNLEVHLLGDNSHLAKTLRSTEAMLKRTEDKAKKFGKSMTRNVTLPLAAMGLAASKAIVDFDKAMTESLAIMKNITPQIRKEMEETAISISSQGVKSAEELARSYFFLASAGFDAKQSIAALSTVESFATAGTFDMALATDLLTDAQSALGLTVKDSEQNMKNMARISDVLVKANVLANASVEQFSTALTSKAATAMKSFNIELEEGVSILAAYADQGIKAQLAGSMFDRMLRLLLKSINDNKEVWDKFNIRTTDAMGNLVPLADIIEDLTERTKGMGAAQKTAMLDMLGFEARSQQAILPLLGLSNKIRDYEKNLRSAGGVTEDVANKIKKSLSAQFKILWNNIKNASIELRNEFKPILLGVLSHIQKAVQWFRDLDVNTKKWIVALAAVAAILGPLTLVLFTFLSLGIKILSILVAFGPAIIVFTVMATAIWAIVDAFTKADLKIINFFRNIRIGGTSVGAWMDALGTYIWQTWDWAINKSILIWETLWVSVKELGAKIKRVFLAMGQFLDEVFWIAIGSITRGLASLLRNTAETMSRVKGMSQKVVDSIIESAASMEFKVSQASTKSAASYKKAIEDSLDESAANWKKYYEKVTKLDAENAARMKKWAVARQLIFGTDAMKAQAVGGAGGAGVEGTVAAAEQVNIDLENVLQRRTDMMNEQARKQIEIERQKNEVIVTGVGALFGAMAQIAQIGGKKTFKIYKSLALAEAGIAAYSAFNKALASPPGPPATYPVAAAALAIGLLRVRQIAMMKPGGGFSGGGGGGGRGVTASPKASTPPEEISTQATDRPRDRYTIIIENVNGTADDEFADKLAESLMNRSVDGREYGFETTSR